jgi:hypothetical protein
MSCRLKICCGALQSSHRTQQSFSGTFRVDAAGVPLDHERALARLRKATSAAIFSYVDSYLGQGIVGGPLLSTEELGRRMAAIAVRILSGEMPENIRSPPLMPGAAMYDWRELTHWKISEARLPPGSIVRFRENGLGAIRLAHNQHPAGAARAVCNDYVVARGAT